MSQSKWSQDLGELSEQVADLACGYGLDFFETIFERVDYSQMNEVAAYGGFPSRYPHWSYGMQYDQLTKGYAYGLQRIYELVINNDPAYAYLLESNHYVDQKLVMAHVFGHVDFFKNNAWFRNTNRKMVDSMANHGARIRMYAEKYGETVVEDFVDSCLSLDNLIDYHAPHVRRRVKAKRVMSDSEQPSEVASTGLRSDKAYMNAYINPPEFLASLERRRAALRAHEKQVPAEPERDVLLFLLEHAPLQPWQQDILGIIRDEAYYFAPQGQTKIMNEGWATFWHTRMMTRNLLEASEVIDYADHHSGTVYTQPGGLNPYKLGLELFRNIEERWDRGQFGGEWEE
jgi:stage V sporulation protein R